MRWHPTRAVRAALATALLAMIAAACGGGGGTASDTPTPATERAAPAAATTAPATEASTVTATPAPTVAPAPAGISAPPGWIDFHNHGVPGIALAQVVPLWTQQGIGASVIFVWADPEDPLGTQMELAAARAQQDRVLPFFDPSSADLRTETAESLRSALEPLLTDHYVGLGEVVLGTITPYAQPVLPDDPTLDALWDLARDHHLVVSLHVDPGPAYLDALERLLEQRADVTFVWAHTGIAGFPLAVGPVADVDAYFERVARMLDTFPNLYADLSTWDPQNSFAGPSAQRWVDLVEAYPTRFMWGSDFSATPAYYGEPAGANDDDLASLDITALAREYLADLAVYRDWMATLDPATAQAVTRDNALSLLAAAGN